MASIARTDIEVPTPRKNYLFLIGIDEYQHLNKLNNAVRDAEAVGEMLTTHYDCEIPEFAQPLLNGEVTLSNLNKRFHAIARHFQQQAYQHNLLIYYAGHGEVDEVFNDGYWALNEAKGRDFSTYFSNAYLIQIISSIPSHHTLIISDSCFSGQLVQSGKMRGSRKEQDRSRYVLASGLKDQKVADGRGKHSPFASAILEFLEEKRGNAFKVQELEMHVEKELLNHNQEPILAPLVLHDNQYGELWLRPKFDVVAELERVLEAGGVGEIEGFMERHLEELTKKKKLSYARKEFQNRFWGQVQNAENGLRYLDFLERFFPLKKERPEQAMKALRSWIEMRGQEREELEEEVALWQSRYEKGKKELDRVKGKVQDQQQFEQEKIKQLEKLEEEVALWQSRYEKGKKERDRMKGKVQDQQQSEQEKIKQLEKLEEEVALWQSRYEKGKKELDRVKGKVRDQQQSEQEKIKQLEKLEEEVALWQNRYGKAKKEHDRLKGETQEQLSQQKKIQQLEGLLEKEKKQRAERQQTIQLLSDEQEQLMKTIAELKRKTITVPQPSSIIVPQELLLSQKYGFPIPEMVLVEGGTFLMGNDEDGRFEVTLDSFFIGKYPVTQKEWQAIMGKNPSLLKGIFKSKNLPVEAVSWNNSQQFIEMLNQKTGLQFRLPTEAEWEYAAGGGAMNRTEWAGTNEEALLEQYAWYEKNSSDQTQAVGKKKPNRLGLYDMSGNVGEWCEDWYGKYPSEPQVNPKGPESGARRVVRGGGWVYSAHLCRVSYRGYGDPVYGIDSKVGFRLALVPQSAGS